MMESTKEKGMSIFLDVFRRADKNDDGCLSWDEFRSFFTDGVLSEEELTNLFHEIDSHNTNNIDTEELCTYFSAHLGPFRGIFCALEDLNRSVSEALCTSAQEYPKGSLVEQFTSRFLLREITGQLAALHHPLEAAGEALDSKSLESSPKAEDDDVEETDQSASPAVQQDSAPREYIEVDPENIDKVAKGSIYPGRLARRARRQLSTQTSWTTESVLVGGGIGSIGQQIERLRSLVDRLENKANFGRIPEESVHQTEDDLMVVVSRTMHVEEGHEKAFRTCLRSYVEAASEADGCLNISVEHYIISAKVAIYEVWKSQDAWKSFCTDTASKSFRHSTIDHLVTPEQLNSIKLPGSWWPKE